MSRLLKTPRCEHSLLGFHKWDYDGTVFVDVRECKCCRVYQWRDMIGPDPTGGWQVGRHAIPFARAYKI